MGIKSEKFKKRRSLGSKILSMILFINLILSIMLAATFKIVAETEFSKLRLKAEANAIQATKIIDAEKLKIVINNKSMNGVEYKEIRDKLITFKSDKQITYAYTMIKKDDKACILVDGNAEDASTIGEEYNLESGMIKAFNGKNASTHDPVKDKYGVFISAYAPIKDASGNIIAIVGIDENVDVFISMKSKLFKGFISLGIVGFIISILAISIFSRKISYNVKQIRDGLKKMEDGDLTVLIEVHSRDEIQSIAEYINNFSKKSKLSIEDVKNTSEEVMTQAVNLSSISEEIAASSQEVSSTIENVAEGANLQSEKLLTITSFVNSFGEEINEAVNSIKEVNFEAEVVKIKAESSNKDLKLLKESIVDINSAFDDIKIKIEGLGSNISQINEISNLINSIAAQTNLLALNAAIEAARAGEAGKGFSVVAEEIRKLAEQSQTSASNINSLLETIMEESDLVVDTSQNMKDKLNNQIGVIKNSAGSFKEIIEKIEDIIPKINDVNYNIGNINNQKEQIIKDIESISSASQEVAASTEEITAATEQVSLSTDEVAGSSVKLRGLTKKLTENVNWFKI